MNNMTQLTRSWLYAAGVPDSQLAWISTALLVAASLLMAWLVSELLRWIAGNLIARLVGSTLTRLDDHLLSPKVLRRAIMLVAALLLRFTLPAAVVQYDALVTWVSDGCALAVVITAVTTVCALIAGAYGYFHERDRHQAGALYNLNQTLQLLTWLVGIVIGISILFHRSPLYVLSGIGASAAVLMLVFRDTILGFVARIQLNLNDMVHPGDWICAPKFGINGIVEKVGLTTVKVRNYDMSTVTVPPYSLFTESFQNWKSMQSLNARRIMRSVCIDADSVGIISADQLSGLASEPWMEGVDTSARQVNLTVFRRWLEWTLQRWPSSVNDRENERYIFSMVRELQPTPQGIPVEIYMFTDRTAWADYERVQADVTDHVIAMVGEFGLRVYQAPAADSILALRTR